MTNEYGIVKSEICRRDGCAGIIDEHEKEGSCSCHINPPCSYCTTDTAYCPTCGWEASDEPQPEIDIEQQKRNQEYWQKQQREWEQYRQSFFRKYRGEEPAEKLEFWSEGHTHFSMKKYAVYPKGSQTRASLLPELKGTFGGRFEQFSEYGCCFIAYTD